MCNKVPYSKVTSREEEQKNKLWTSVGILLESQMKASSSMISDIEYNQRSGNLVPI